MNNNFNSILNIYIKDNSDLPIPYASDDNIIPFMILNLLKKNKKSFLTHPKYNEFQWFNHKYNEKDLQIFKDNIKLDPFIYSIKNKYAKCKKLKKLIIIHLTIVISKALSHSNIIIINCHTNEMERFEPHGGYSNVGYNKNALNIDMRAIAEYLNLKYIPPLKSCLMGFQSYENFASHKKFENDKYIIQDSKGYCTAWSYFYADMKLKFPHLTHDQIFKKSIDIIGSHPEKLRSFIRGQMKFLVTHINKINKLCPFEKYIAAVPGKTVTKKTKSKSNTYNYQSCLNSYNDYIQTEFQNLYLKLNKSKSIPTITNTKKRKRSISLNQPNKKQKLIHID